MRLELQGVLNSPTRAEEIFSQVVSLAEEHQHIEVDLADAIRMTPSFANTLVMRLMASPSFNNLDERVQFVNASCHVAAALQRARERFSQGIRLSDQALV